MGDEGVILTLGILAVFIFLPLILIGLKLYNEKKYNIIARVHSKIGQKDGKTIITNDRIGYVNIVDDKDRKTGAKRWKLMKNKGQVMDFSYARVYEVKGLFGKQLVTDIYAPNGEKGDEFYQLPCDAVLPADYKPIITTQKSQLFYTTMMDIMNRNKIENWWKQNLIPLVLSGLALLCCIMLFLCFLTLKDVADTFKAASVTNSQCTAGIQQVLNITQNKTEQKPAQPGILPFGIG